MRYVTLTLLATNDVARTTDPSSALERARGASGFVRYADWSLSAPAPDLSGSAEGDLVIELTWSGDSAEAATRTALAALAAAVPGGTYALHNTVARSPEEMAAEHGREQREFEEEVARRKAALRARPRR